jgi:hypothetical protein
MRTRTVIYLEGKIIRELSKRQGVSTDVIRNIRSIDEEHNLDIAYINLLTKKEICKSTDYTGMIVYKLVA